MRNPLRLYGVGLILAMLILASFLNVYYEEAYHFQSRTSGEIIAATVTLNEIESLTIPLAESIPLIKDWAHTYENDFDRLVRYLDLSSGLILIQLTLLELSRWMVLKWIMVLLFAGFWVPLFRSACLKLILIALLLSPGLSWYTGLMQGVVHAVQMDLGADLHQKLEATKDSVQQQKVQHQAKLDSLKQVQKERHHGRLSLGNRLEDGFLKVSYKVEDDMDEMGRSLLDILRFTGRNAVQAAMELLVRIIVVFALFPLLYLYILSLLIQRLFIFERNTPPFFSKLNTPTKS